MSQAAEGRIHVDAFVEVPQIDIGPMFLGDPQARRSVGDAVRDACRGVGFFYIRNHGVSQSIVDEAFRQMARFSPGPRMRSARSTPTGRDIFAAIRGFTRSVTTPPPTTTNRTR